jgi:hypothetical protein
LFCLLVLLLHGRVCRWDATALEKGGFGFKIGRRRRRFSVV